MRILPFKIPKTSGDTLIVQEDKGDTFYDKLHQHEEIQLSLIVFGEGSLIVGDTITNYKAGDVLAFGSQVPHVLKSRPLKMESYMISIFFTKQSFGDGFFKLAEFEEMSSFFTDLSFGVAALSYKKQLKEQFLAITNEKHRLDRFMIFLNILRLFSKGDIVAISSTIPKKNYTDDQGKRMAAVFQFVMNGFDGDINLQEVSDIANMTPNAFCRYFKQRTNKTFFQFLAEVRLENACQILSKEPDRTIAEASYSSGFKNISNFNRKFKEIRGITPSGFRKNLHNSHLF